jgi:hypothetical protein
MNANADAVRQSCIRIAAHAAHMRLSRMGWTLEEIHDAAEPMADRIAAAVAATLPAALADAKEAAALGMNDVAQATIRASAALAGVDAANAHHLEARGPVIVDA